jgi:hypothetical protein
MKIRILKDILVEVEKPKLEEVWDQQLRRWDELNVVSIIDFGKESKIITYDGSIYFNVPNESFDVLES